MILKNRHKELILQLASRHLSPDVKLIVYGSRAEGSAHDASDLDLALRHIEDTPVDSDQLLTFKNAVRESTIPFLVDIFDWARLPESFHKAIEDQGIVLFSEVKN